MPMPDGASPQLEDGHLHLAQELLEAMCKLRCPPSVMGAFLAVIRETYGWNEKTRTVPLTKIAKHMGVGYDRARQAVSEAVRWNLVTRKGHKLEVQKDYTRWGRPEDEARNRAYRKAGHPNLESEGRGTQLRGTQEEGRGADLPEAPPGENREAGVRMESEGRATGGRQRQKDITTTPPPNPPAAGAVGHIELSRLDGETATAEQVASAFLREIGYDGPPSQQTYDETLDIIEKELRDGKTMQTVIDACAVAALDGARGPRLIPHKVGKKPPEETQDAAAVQALWVPEEPEGPQGVDNPATDAAYQQARAKMDELRAAGKLGPPEPAEDPDADGTDPMRQPPEQANGGRDE